MLKFATSITKIKALVLEIDFYLLRVVRPLMYCDGMFAVLPVGYDEPSSGDIILPPPKPFLWALQQMDKPGGFGKSGLYLLCLLTFL